MNEIAVRRWSATNDETLTEAAVRARYPPPKYRVSVYRYPPGTKVGGGFARSGTCYVVSGAVRFLYKSEVTLRAGDVADLPDGHFSLEVIGNAVLVIIQCWELPFPFNRAQ